MSANEKNPDARPGVFNEALLEALRNAYAPTPLEPSLNERLIESALLSGVAPPMIGVTDTRPRDAMDNDDVPISSTGPEELAQAQLLADALAGDGSHPLANLADVVRTAYSPTVPDMATSDALLTEALRRPAPHPKVVRLRSWSYSTMAMALAAGVALWVGRPTPTATSRQQLVQSHSAAPLFAETFDQKTPTERIDYIYAVRSRELRHNRYASWRIR